MNARFNFPRSLASLAVAIALVPAAAPAQVVPTGFEMDFAVGEPFTGPPVSFARLPDGRILIVERDTGVVRLATVGASSSVAIHTVPGVEGVHPERGLLGVATDPAWPARPYVYCYYNHISGFARVTMFTASGELSNPSSSALSLGSAYDLLVDIPDVNGIHNGGALRFDCGSRLLLSLGDDALACQAQTLDSLLGGVLRLDVSAMPGTGSGPPAKSELAAADNPFLGLGANASLRLAWGLRNPFRFTIDPPTGRLVIGDVGSSFFEEINVLAPPSGAGSNFGWPQLEGFQTIFCCGTCGQGNPFVAPVHILPHLPGVTSIVAGPIVRGNPAESASFPSSYEGDLFFFEFFTGVMRRLRETGGAWAIAPPALGQPDSTNWATGLFGVADAQMAPDGTMELIVFGLTDIPRGLYRIRRSVDTAAPEVVATRPDDIASLRVAPNPASSGTRVTITSLGTIRLAPVPLCVCDASGRILRRLAATLDARGAPRWEWDGTESDGSRAAPGVYFLTPERSAEPIPSTRVTILR